MLVRHATWSASRPDDPAYVWRDRFVWRIGRFFFRCFVASSGGTFSFPSSEIVPPIARSPRFLRVQHCQILPLRAELDTVTKKRRLHLGNPNCRPVNFPILSLWCTPWPSKDPLLRHSSCLRKTRPCTSTSTNTSITQPRLQLLHLRLNHLSTGPSHTAPQLHAPFEIPHLSHVLLERRVQRPQVGHGERGERARSRFGHTNGGTADVMRLTEGYLGKSSRTV